MPGKRGRPRKKPSPAEMTAEPAPQAEHAAIVLPDDMTSVDRIVCADCVSFLAGYRGPKPKLIFADPPFNIGYQYDRYHDRRPYDEYYSWTVQWMRACAQALDPAGSFYVAIGDEYAAEICTIGKRELGLTLRNWIIWQYTFGQAMQTKFARAHAHIFYFVKDPKSFTFNDTAVRVPSDRQMLYNDPRANPIGKMPDDVWTLCRDCARKNSLAGGDAHTDIWLTSRVCGTFKERVQWHPCQMPETLLARIVAVSSDPGDLVFDPFSGSGTTLAVANRLGRHWLGTDISPDYVANATARIRSVYPNDTALPCGSRPDATDRDTLFSRDA